MAKFTGETSRTFFEYRFLQGETKEECVADDISLRTPFSKFKFEDGIDSAKIVLNIPFISAAMQAVTGPDLATSLAQEGGMGVVYCSQTIEDEAAMIRQVKRYKAGFVNPITLLPTDKVEDAFQKAKQTRHSIYPITTNEGVLLGAINVNYLQNEKGKEKLQKVMWGFKEENLEKIVTSMEKNKPEEIVQTVRQYVPFAYSGITLEDANKIIKESGSKFLAVINQDRTLDSLVFRKDIEKHLNHPNELIDLQKRMMVAGAINTHDYKERIPALVKAGVDMLVVDSSDGYTEFQKECIEFSKKNFEHIPIMGGNVISGKGFRYLVDAGADAVKIGMGGGSICITQEQKGTGRGQATAVYDVNQARADYLNEKGIYIPIISDGGHSMAKDMTLALAFGANAVMLGRIFAATTESNAPFDEEGRNKQYWGEGHERAKAWREKRYGKTGFNEGVDALIPCAGGLGHVLNDITIKMRSTMQTVGAINLQELYKNAEVELISFSSVQEGKPHDIILKDNNQTYKAQTWGL